jgi:hypothetical protein
MLSGTTHRDTPHPWPGPHLVLASTPIRKRERYRDPGANYRDGYRKDQLLHPLRRRIEQLGYAVSLEPMAVAAD